MLSIREIKIWRSCYHPLFFQLWGERNTFVLLVVTLATSVKTAWSLAVHFFVLLLVKLITLEAIWQFAILLMSYVSMFSPSLLFNNVSVLSQILKEGKNFVELTARYFNSLNCYPISPHGYLKVQLIEEVFCDVSKDIDIILWEREIYWQCQLFTNTCGLSSMSDSYSRSRNSCKKK